MKIFIEISKPKERGSESLERPPNDSAPPFFDSLSDLRLHIYTPLQIFYPSNILN